MSAHGHYFCDFCDDVAHVKYDGTLLIGCPTCHHLTCHWVPDQAPRKQRVMTLMSDEPAVPVPTAAERAANAAHWFAKMRQACA
jgi:hypothetical protein